MILRIFGFVVSGIISLVIYFEVSNFKFSSDEPNKDRLLVDLVSYVLDKLHYDPKIINDDFSIKVFDDFIDLSCPWAGSGGLWSLLEAS